LRWPWLVMGSVPPVRMPDQTIQVENVDGGDLGDGDVIAVPVLFFPFPNFTPLLSA